MPEKLYAFWKYDRPPYILGGEVLKIREDNGGVYVKGYDQYMSNYFRKEAIIAIVPYSEGVKLQKKVDTAEHEYRLTVKEAENKLDDLRDLIASKGEI